MSDAAAVAFARLVERCLAGVSLQPRFVPRAPMDDETRRAVDRERKRKERGAARPRPPPDLEPGPAARQADDQQVRVLEAEIAHRWR
ncbi:hypothetical protein LMG23992_02116 [Cupriavidus laharis]|uniref:Uncharacterized protein n=1 Tax=Cupriavidus laharis TaxID=151654 RepID=A0ABM8WX54_9BURK|nr:hypothetical protein [Cupriavidus laharis]CAG9172090.1 hypothetical protein LMG23992_02116 [Cupriavidus laharis]